MHYDIVILGGGPGGYVAAIRAAQWGARVAVVEKEELGGTCLNRGCIPTKVFTAAAGRMAQLKEAADWGLETGPVQIQWEKILNRKNQVVARLVKGIHFLFKKNKITLVKGTGRLTGTNQVTVNTPEGEELVLTGQNIILATGSEPALITDLGYDGQRVITSNEALNLMEIPRRLTIIGGGVIGCEFASIFREMGNEVTVIEAMKSILPTVDPEISRQLGVIFRKAGISVKAGVKVEQVEKGEEITLTLSNGEKVAADLVLISIGRQLNTRGIGLENLGVALGERGEVLVDEYGRTSVPGIYAIGDITGKLQLAHVASYQGLVAVAHILGKELPPLKVEEVPACIFTRPEIATVGLTALEAEARGYKVKTAKFPFMAIGKAQAMGETEGFVKIVIEAESGEILGWHIIGPHASDLIAEGTLALVNRLGLAGITRTVHAHPTLAEAMLEAAEAAHDLAIHI
ncbi:dihydrolipoyl dehydrogenase [Carboxydocella sp. ULO1]|uniref:dihydrolipoyl dehydrogenase n=1 Tax=Carboxydocella sp. ULO1 TaxID=1926599 RepID=UPI0009ACBF5C|nr:dihydrolipoyl dehydrogenase [Carboxydocella sp. ULO1]GAW28498.1 dihydrolipoyl dehydrogenase [Carboxydocella sp. ULO1]